MSDDDRSTNGPACWLQVRQFVFGLTKYRYNAWWLYSCRFSLSLLFCLPSLLLHFIRYLRKGKKWSNRYGISVVMKTSCMDDLVIVTAHDWLTMQMLISPWSSMIHHAPDWWWTGGAWRQMCGHDPRWCVMHSQVSAHDHANSHMSQCWWLSAGGALW